MIRTLVLAVAVALQGAGAAAPAAAGGLPDVEAPSEAAAAPPEPAATPPEPAPQPAPVPDTTPAPLDPSARLLAGDEAAEHWDLAAHFTSGDRLYARFLITNAGPGERSAAAFGHWVAPDGQAHEFRNGRLSGRWQLSGDRRHIRIGSSVLAFPADQRHFEVDNDKRGIKIRLDFPDDASALAGPERDDGYRVDLLNLATPARGSFWLKGMASTRPVEGRVLLTHSWFPGPEGRHVLRRLDVASLAPGPRLFVSEVVPPKGRAWRWVAAADGGRVEGIAGVEWTARGGSGGDYPVPARLEMGGKGHSGTLSLGPKRLEVDPLDALPTLVRMVYSFGLRPRHVWVDSTADVVLKSPARDAVLRFQGAGIATFYFSTASPRASASSRRYPPGAR